MGMRQEVIDIRGRSLKDRRKLRDFLLRLEEEIYHIKDPCGPYSPENRWNTVIYHHGHWVGSDGTTSISTTIEEFIAKYSPTIKLSKIYRI
jgi:hypothetical protein